MSRGLIRAGLMGLLLALAACSGSEPEGTESTAGDAGGAGNRGKNPKAQAQLVIDENYRYDPTGKPDPFRSFIKAFLTAKAQETTGPLERFDLSQLHVTAIIWGNERPRALIKDPAGKGYIVSIGTPIGKNRGRVIEIDDNLVLVKETYVDFRGQATTKDIEMRLNPVEGG